MPCADNIEDATAEFTAAELAIVRGREAYTDDMVLKIMDGTIKLAWKWTAMHPRIRKPPETHEMPYTYFFRMAFWRCVNARR
jgi:hypothetical protein